MNKIIPIFILIIGIVACQSDLEEYGQQYQKNGELATLKKAFPLLETETDTAIIKKILGEPIDMGFDFRYLTQKTGENGCVIGAVFHIDEHGRIDDRWMGEICE